MSIKFVVKVDPENVIDFTAELVDKAAESDLYFESTADDTGQITGYIQSEETEATTQLLADIETIAAKYVAPVVSPIDPVEDPMGECGKADDMGEEWRIKRQWRDKDTPNRVQYETKIKLPSNVTDNFKGKVASIASKQKNTTINVASEANATSRKTTHTLTFVSDRENLKVAVDAVFNEIAKYQVNF